MPELTPYQQRLAAEYQAERLEAAKTLGKYCLEHECETVLDEMGEHLSARTTFDEFQDWIKGYTYYTALVCSCEDSDEVESRLRDDYEEVMRKLSPD